MLGRSTLFLALLALSTLALAEQSTQQQTANDAPDNTACSFTYSSGNGMTQTQYCLSVKGNIVQFSRPSSVEYINNGLTIEGYGVCDVTGSESYFDYAAQVTDNWEPTVVTAPNATTRKFVRKTNSGVWELTQAIQQAKASGSLPGRVQITMTLKNLSGITRNVYLLRVADVDLLDVDTGVTTNEFDFTWDTAYGSSAGFHGFGLALTNNTFKYGHNAFTRNTPFGPDPCDFTANQNPGPFVGDGSIGHVWGQAALHPGSKMTVVMTYRPI